MIRLTNSIKRKDTLEAGRVMEIVSLAFINNPEKWKFSLHEHSDLCEAVYVAGGEGEYTVDDHTYPIEEGMIVLINKNTGHIQTSNPANPLTLWNMSIRVREMDELGENMLLPSGYKAVFPAGRWKTACEACCRELFREMMERGEYYEAMSLSMVEQYLLLSLRALKSNGELLEEKKKSLAVQVKKYIDENYAKDITLDHLAVTFHCNKYHLAHEMKKNYHISPVNYLINRRIGEAQNLICTTKLPINEIARVVGYENTNYFNRLFCKKVGLAPTQFRDEYENIK